MDKKDPTIHPSEIKQHSRSSILQKVFFIFLGFAAVFIVCIITERVIGMILNKAGYFKAMTPSINEIHETNEFSVTANISSQGIRNEEVIIPKPKDTYRILALGDSFTFGWGVQLEQSWPKLLEKSLKVPGKKVEVINAGKPGASPTNTRQICKAYKDQFEVDAIVVGLYTDDLLQAGVKEAENQEHPIQTIIEDLFPTLSRVNKQIVGYKRYSNINPGEEIVRIDYSRDQMKETLKRDPTILLKIPPKLRNLFLKGFLNPAIAINAKKFPDLYTYMLDEKRFNFALESLDKRLAKLNDRCSKGLPAVIVFLPSEEIVSDYYFPFKKEFGFEIDNRLVTFDVDTHLKQIIEKNGFTFYSPLPDFRKNNGCTNCFYPYDGHFTSVGHKIVADYLAQHMSK